LHSERNQYQASQSLRHDATTNPATEQQIDPPATKENANDEKKIAELRKKYTECSMEEWQQAGLDLTKRFTDLAQHAQNFMTYAHPLLRGAPSFSSTPRAIAYPPTQCTAPGSKLTPQFKAKSKIITRFSTLRMLSSWKRRRVL